MLRHLLIAILKTYRVLISPLLGPCCRFSPSCSVYTIDAVRTHGSVRGLWMGLCRLCKCHPLHPGGYDPVPLALRRGKDA